MNIVKFPHPALFKKCQDVTVFGKELKILLDGMWDAMVASNGVGLSANQVQLPFNMFVMEGPSKEKLYIVNPKIIKKSNTNLNLNEGCLSAPGEFLVVPERAEWIEFHFQNELGENMFGRFEDIYSVCVQHEMQHLRGESFMESKSVPVGIRKRLAKKWGFK